MKEKHETWCNDWFNSPWYHKLYSHRDEQEAKAFIVRLTGLLKLDSKARVLDLACGKGRHSIVLNELGFDVTGVDLSENNIAEAKKSENEKLRFLVHDMRDVLRADEFDAVFNLFTSFGYMEKDSDNKRVIESAHADLKKDGVLVIDFLNAAFVRKVVKEHPEGMLREGNAAINWSKRIIGNTVEKKIKVKDAGNVQSFCERVKLYTKDEMLAFLGDAFATLNIFGNYKLEPFDESSSDRLIIIARRK